jgi:hypothetical protein
MKKTRTITLAAAYRLVGKPDSLFWIRSDGSGGPQKLLRGPNLAISWSFSPDGRRLAYFERSPETVFDIWTLPLDLTDPDPASGPFESRSNTPAANLVM